MLQQFIKVHPENEIIMDPGAEQTLNIMFTPTPDIFGEGFDRFLVGDYDDKFILPILFELKGIEVSFNSQQSSHQNFTLPRPIQSSLEYEPA